MSVINWPTRVPGQPYLWVTDLDSREPSSRCVLHKKATTREGVCFDCTADWLESLGADRGRFRLCQVCRLPLHPAVEAEGTHPSCGHSAGRLAAGIS
jgi:hypothetical protein